MSAHDILIAIWGLGWVALVFYALFVIGDEWVLSGHHGIAPQLEPAFYDYLCWGWSWPLVLPLAAVFFGLEAVSHWTTQRNEAQPSTPTDVTPA